MGRQRVPLERSLNNRLFLAIRCLEEGQVPTHEPPHQGNEPEDEEEQDGGGGSHALTLSFEPTDVLLTSGPVDRWCGFDRDRPPPSPREKYGWNISISASCGSQTNS